MKYIDGFYHSRRRHSALDYSFPNEVYYSYQHTAIADRIWRSPLSEIFAADH